MGGSANDVLAHYGVKGMRWGKRKSESLSTRRTETSEDYDKFKDLRPNAKPTLSNKELKFLNERLQLEKTYGELTKQTTPVARGQKFVKGIVAVGGTATALYNMYNSPMGKAVKSAIESRVK